MPAIDTELIQPLTSITETLLKRPGIVTMQSIKRLSEMYGFTTFVEYIKGNGSTNTNMIRLSISGLILLIDIDFELPMEMQIGSPMSPNVNNNNYNGVSLPNTSITGVSISSAITPDAINGESYDFLFGFGEFQSCSDILHDNLKEKTLDSFNMNLRVLLLFDRLSKNKPNDLFTIFSELVWGLNKQNENEKGDEKDQDWEDGIKGVGKVLANRNNKVGIFLQYWIDNRHVNRWICENKKDCDVVDRVYQMRFKVKESLNYNKHSVSDIKDDIKEADDATKVKDDDGDVDMDVDVKENAGNEETSQDKDTQGRLYNVKDNTWKTDSGEDKEEISLVTLELCPPVWIPEDVISGIEGLEYEIISADNENWADNTIDDSGGDDYRRWSECGDKLLDVIYKQVNSGLGNGCVVLEDASTHEEKYRVDVLVGSRMVRLFKVQIGDMNRLRTLVGVLRKWCKLNSVLCNSVGASSVGVSPDRPSSEDGEVSLEGLFASSDQTPVQTPLFTLRNGSLNGLSVGTDGFCVGDAAGAKLVELAEALSLQ